MKKKRESYMSDEDLKEKIRREPKRRRNAERRTKYQENRINSEEMKAFEDEDHRDFMYMFKRVEKGSLNDDIKILFESQEKALAQKNQKGNRWQPKYSI